MKRYFPLVFLVLTLLAKVFSHVSIMAKPLVWPPAPAGRMPLWLEAFTFLSGPACILIFLVCWVPPEQGKGLSRVRKRAGTALFSATALLWFFFLFQLLQAAWVVSTPTQYPLYWLGKYFQMYRLADISLVVGGFFSLWVKGIRMPPSTR